VLDREDREAFTEDIGDRETRSTCTSPEANAPRYEALTDALFANLVTEELTRSTRENTHPWNDPRVVDFWSTPIASLSPRDKGRAS